MLAAPASELIHPTAVVHPEAELHPTVRVGPYAVIGEHVKIGPHTTVGAHAIVDGWTEIGARNRIFPGAAIGLEPQDLKYDGSLTLVKIGDDNTLREYVTVNRATFAGETTAIGNGNLLMAYVHVGHNCTIEDRAIVANAVALSGHVHVESQARISGVLGVHQFVRIGCLSMVGGMSRIERDVPPYMLVEGNPSRVRAINRVGLERAGFAEDSLKALKNAYRHLYRSPHGFQEALQALAAETDPHVTHLRTFLEASVSDATRRGPIPGRI